VDDLIKVRGGGEGARAKRGGEGGQQGEWLIRVRQTRGGRGTSGLRGPAMCLTLG
jgi:hypothetical protein